MKEHGYAVKPRSTAKIAVAAERFLLRCAPEHISSGESLDLGRLADYGLHQESVVVYPVSPADLPDAEAETRAVDGRWIEILMREEFFAALFERNSNTNRARSTLAHEIGHAVLHKSDVRIGRQVPEALAMRRAPRTDLKPFEDSEWQAYAFAGALLMPRPALRKAGLDDIPALAQRFEVSEAFVESHLRLIKRVL